MYTKKNLKWKLQIGVKVSQKSLEKSMNIEYKFSWANET